MECKNCELRQRQFYCENCLRTHLRDFRLKTAHFATDRDDQVAKATRALDAVAPARIARATVARRQEQLEEALNGLARMRVENDRKRERLRMLREGLAARRRTLTAARRAPTGAAPSIARETQELAALSATLARARAGLVQELVECFGVVEVGGRPPIGGKAGTKGEWTIGDLILPVPGDIRRYPPDHINAVLTHTIHFLSLLTFYLGIKLPFEVSWSGGKLGVGTPSIGATRGTEAGGWAKWHTKHPLHLSASVPDPAPPTPPEPSPPRAPAESYTEPAPGDAPPRSFTTALAMLLYNVAYLAHTQGVDVPLAHAGDVLRNLWSVCCSADLGRRSHETAPRLPPPTPPAFALDFAQLLQATAATPAARARTRTHTQTARAPARIVEEDDGWDLVDDDPLAEYAFS